MGKCFILYYALKYNIKKTNMIKYLLIRELFVFIEFHITNSYENYEQNKSLRYKLEELIFGIIAAFITSMFISALVIIISDFIVCRIFNFQPIFYENPLNTIILFVAMFAVLYRSWTNFNNKLNIKESYLKEMQSYLNTSYINMNDKEKVYLLHELIKKYGVINDASSRSQLKNYLLDLKLDVKKSNFNFIKFTQDNYQDQSVAKMLREEVIPQKELDLFETETFFNNYIQPALECDVQDKHKSL